MFVVAAAALIIAMALVLFRAIAGPTLYDRVLAVNSFGTKTVLLIGVAGFLTGRPDFLDIALLYALINFVATIAILKFFRYQVLAPVMLGDTLFPDDAEDRRDG
jgi:multicomponent Na+:H+ antiporter subunit F